MSVGSPRLQSPQLSDAGLSSSSEVRSERKKRKRDDEEKPISKRAAKRKKSKAAKGPIDDGLDVETGVNHAIGHMDSQLLADHIAQRTKRFQPDLSMLELEELRIPASSIHDTSTWQSARDTDSLPDFLEKAKSTSGRLALNQSPRQPGSPHTLIVAGAGLRAADLTRGLRTFQTKDAKVEKLFAKHIKMQEAIQSAKKTRIGIGVGTPQRIMDLLDDGALSAKRLERIVVDASHIDVKKRGVLDMREIEVPLLKLLCRKDLSERYAKSEGGIDLYFY